MSKPSAEQEEEGSSGERTVVVRVEVHQDGRGERFYRKARRGMVGKVHWGGEQIKYEPTFNPEVWESKEPSYCRDTWEIVSSGKGTLTVKNRGLGTTLWAWHLCSYTSPDT